MLTGISVAYDKHLLYECSNTDVIRDFRSYLDSRELQRVDRVYLWFSLGRKRMFIVAEPRIPAHYEDDWVVKSDEFPEFMITHSEGRNLLDEIEEQVKQRSGSMIL